MSDTLRVGVIGLNRGMGHVRVFNAMPDVELAAVADMDEPKLERTCRDYNVPHGVSSLTELLDVGLDVVVLATPIPQHVAHTQEALQAGVHVLAEVPALATREEADQLVEAVEASDKHYMMAENCCYWAFVDTFKELKQRGEFGEIFYAEGEYFHNIPQLRRDAQGNPTWRATMQPITYLTHELGPIMSITGAYPVEVSCYGTGDNFEPGHTDLHAAIFRMNDGSLTRISTSFANAHWGNHRIALMGTKGSVDTGWLGRDQMKYWSTTIPNLTTPIALPVGVNHPRAPQAATLGGHGTAEWFMIQDFLRSIREGTRPPIDVYDSIMYSLPGVCAVESAQTGKPVAIPQYQERRPRQ